MVGDGLWICELKCLILIVLDQGMKANESQNVEYKRSWQGEYLKWVYGFANAQGGAI